MKFYPQFKDIFLLFSKNKSGNSATIGLTTRGYETELQKHTPSGQWVHVTCVYNEKNKTGNPEVSFYLNGELEPHHFNGSGSAKVDIRVNTVTDHPASTPFSIGSSMELKPNYDLPRKSALDELHIIADALSPEEVKFLFENNKLME